MRLKELNETTQRVMTELIPAGFADEDSTKNFIKKNF